MKTLPNKSASEVLSILAHDLALWWLNSANDEYHDVFPKISLACARSTGVFIGQLGEAAWQGQIQRVLECLDWIEADNHIAPTQYEARAITEYVTILREVAHAAQEGRPPRLEDAPGWVNGVLAHEPYLLGHGETPKIIIATAG